MKSPRLPHSPACVRFALAAIAAALLTAGCGVHKTAPVVMPAPGPRSVPRVEGEVTATQIRLLLKDQLASWQGVPYRHGGLSRQGVDCSGFVQLTFRDKFGVVLPRTAAEQAAVGIPLRRAELESGDLVFFRTGGDDRHVGIVMDGRWFIHASSSRGVIRSSLASPYWEGRFRQGRRVLAPSPSGARAAVAAE